MGPRSLFTADRIIEQTREAAPLYDSLLFLFFFTLHADQLSWTFGEITLRLNNIIALLLALLVLIGAKRVSLLLPRSLLCSLLLLTLSLGLTTWLSPYRARASLFLGWYGITLIAYFLLPYLLGLIWPLKRLLRLYFLSFIAVGLYGAAQLFLSFCRIHDPAAEQLWGEGWVRPNAWAYEPSYLALYLTPFIAIANGHFLMQREQDFFLMRRLNLSALLVINGLFLTTLATTTLFFYLLFLLTLALIPYRSQLPPFHRQVRRFLGAHLLAGVALLAFLPVLSKEFFFKFFFQGFLDHHSISERLIGIYNAFEIFLHHPWFGVGLGSIPSLLFEGWCVGDSRFIYLANPEMIRGAAHVYKCFEPTNVFTELLASAGIMGTAAFSFFLYSYVKRVRLVLFSPTIEVTDKRWVFLFFLSTLIMFIVLQCSQGLFRTYIWTHFALAYALAVRTGAMRET